MTIVFVFRFVESEFGVQHAHENKLWKLFLHYLFISKRERERERLMCI